MRTSSTTKYLTFLLILSTLLALSSCSKKFLGFGYDPKAELALEEIDFEYLSTTTKFKYKDGDTKQKARANIRIKKDSLIWFTLSNGVGIEGFRGKMTRDSLIVIDRVNKKVTSFSFQTLSERFNFEFNFDLFQAVLVGDMPVDVSKADVLEKQSKNYLVTQKAGNLRIQNKISSKSRRLENLVASTLENKNTLELKYGDFKLLEEKAFAYKALMTLTYYKEGKKEEAIIDFEHSRARIESKPLKFPFNIPSRYERQ